MATAVARDWRAPAPSIPPNVHIATTEANFLPESRKYMMLLVTLTASVTYSAAVNPQGAFLSIDDYGGAWDLVFQVMYGRRYLMFFYCNAAAFVASLVVIMLLMSKTVTRHGFRSSAVWVCAGAAMVGLMGAFASASCRSVKTSIYVVALVAAVLFYIGIQVLVFLCNPVENLIHDVPETLGRYLKFGKLEQQIHQQQSIASGLGNGNGATYQILKRSRIYLLLLGILAASVTYQAGLNPPGQIDFAPDARLHPRAGHSVLDNPWDPYPFTNASHQVPDGFWQNHTVPYGPPAGIQLLIQGLVLGEAPLVLVLVFNDNLAFFYCNATAFVASLAIIMLLVNRKLSARAVRWYALWVCVTLDVIGLMGAFAAGGYRKTSMVDVLVVVFAVLVCIAFQVTLSMSETVRCLVRRLLPELGWPQLPLGADPFVEEEGSEDELQFGLAGGTNEEPLGGEISSSILGGALTLILAVPVVAILQTPVKLLVAMMIATIVVGIWRRLFAPSVKALARALQRRCIRNQGTSTFSNLVSALCHGLCKLIHTLCSGAWMWIMIVAIWVPSLKPNLNLKFKMSKISAVLGVLFVSTTAPTTTDTPTTATAAGTSTTTTTAMDTPSTPTSTVMATRTTATTTSDTSMGCRDEPLVEPRPRRNRRPNSRLMGGDWVN